MSLEIKNEEEFKKLVRDAVEDWFNEPPKTKSKWVVCKEMIIPISLIVTCGLFIGYLFYDDYKVEKNTLITFENNQTIVCGDDLISKIDGWSYDKTTEMFIKDKSVKRLSWCSEY